MDREPVPEIFLSMTQAGADGAGYAIRTIRDDADIPKALAAAVAEQNPRIQRVHPVPLHTLVEQSLDSRDAAMRLVGGFGALALLLTAVGVYGVVACRAAERWREMAIRMALGATAGAVRGLIFGQGLRFAVVGFLAGTAGFLAVSPLLKSELSGWARQTQRRWPLWAAWCSPLRWRRPRLHREGREECSLRSCCAIGSLLLCGHLGGRGKLTHVPSASKSLD